MPFLLGAGVVRRVHLGFEAANSIYALPLVSPPSHPTLCARTSDGSLLYTHGPTSILGAVDGIEEIADTTLPFFFFPSLYLVFPCSQSCFLNLIPPILLSLSLTNTNIRRIFLLRSTNLRTLLMINYQKIEVNQL
ncbi:hypothetical protein AMTRI_Chr08g204310 [Amborella trichopoda]